MPLTLSRAAKKEKKEARRRLAAEEENARLTRLAAEQAGYGR